MTKSQSEFNYSRNVILPETDPVVRLSQLFAFFLPLAGSALLVTFSHVIINSTLARAANPEAVISSYAIAIGLYAVLERPVLLLRQTCSALVKDQVSFIAMWRISCVVIGLILTLSAIIAYSPLGGWVFGHWFGVKSDQMQATIDVYRVLIFVSFFSGLRCIFHGIIISHLQTKWMTIGMVIRLIGMSISSAYFITSGVTSGIAGAVIFLLGMAIECVVSTFEGVRLRKKLPKQKEGYTIRRSSDVMSFYRPMVYASVFAVAIGPLIIALLGRAENATLAIAAYSVAMTVGMIFLGIASYTHQIVLNFYASASHQVVRFALMTNFLPGAMLLLLSFTPAGTWVLSNIVGVSGSLLEASLWALRALALQAIVFPWMDYANGMIMLKGQTKIMTFAQLLNLSMVLTTMITLTLWVPHWNGAIGALALSLGTTAELTFVTIILLKRFRGPHLGFGPIRRMRKVGDRLFH